MKKNVIAHFFLIIYDSFGRSAANINETIICECLAVTQRKHDVLVPSATVLNTIFRSPPSQTGRSAKSGGKMSKFERISRANGRHNVIKWPVPLEKDTVLLVHLSGCLLAKVWRHLFHCDGGHKKNIVDCIARTL